MHKKRLDVKASGLLQFFGVALDWKISYNNSGNKFWRGINRGREVEGIYAEKQ